MVYYAEYTADATKGVSVFMAETGTVAQNEEEYLRQLANEMAHEDLPTFHSLTSSRPLRYLDAQTGEDIDPGIFVHPMRYEFQEILE